MKPKKFSGYEVFVIAILTILQFSIILDFMVLSPLGPILRPALNVSTAQFGIVVAAYAISAGLSGLLAAGRQRRSSHGKGSSINTHGQANSNMFANPDINGLLQLHNGFVIQPAIRLITAVNQNHPAG